MDCRGIGAGPDRMGRIEVNPAEGEYTDSKTSLHIKLNYRLY